MVHELSLVEALRAESQQLETFYEEGNPLRLPYSGRPGYAVTSYNPLEYERYGVLRNRAPHITGLIAVRGMLINDDRNLFTGGPKPGLIFESSHQLYADLLIPQTYFALEQALINRLAATST